MCWDLFISSSSESGTGWSSKGVPFSAGFLPWFSSSLASSLDADLFPVSKSVLLDIDGTLPLEADPSFFSLLSSSFSELVAQDFWWLSVVFLLSVSFGSRLFAARLSFMFSFGDVVCVSLFSPVCLVSSWMLTRMDVSSLSESCCSVGRDSRLAPSPFFCSCWGRGFVLFSPRSFQSYAGHLCNCCMVLCLIYQD